jgi:hypothetical protein
MEETLQESGDSAGPAIRGMKGKGRVQGLLMQIMGSRDHFHQNGL